MQVYGRRGFMSRCGELSAPTFERAAQARGQGVLTRYFAAVPITLASFVLSNAPWIALRICDGATTTTSSNAPSAAPALSYSAILSANFAFCKWCGSCRGASA